MTDDKRKKALEFLRSQTDSKLLDKSNYSSPLDQDVIKVKGGVLPEEPITRIRNTTNVIDTKSPMRVGNAADVMKANAEKAARMKALRKIGKPTLGGLAGAALTVGSSLLPDSVIASDVIDTTSRVLEEGDPISLALPNSVGPVEGSFDDRLEKGQLTQEELEMLRSQYAK